MKTTPISGRKTKKKRNLEERLHVGNPKGSCLQKINVSVDENKKSSQYKIRVKLIIKVTHFKIQLSKRGSHITYVSIIIQTNHRRPK